MKSTGLKFNPYGWFFVLKWFTYLGYKITKDDIKSYLRKVKGITDVVVPTTTIGFWVLIGMTQYYG